MKKRVKYIISCFLAFLLLFVLFFSPVQASSFTASAEDKYSSVLDDLYKDEAFFASDYPFKSGDFSLNVIQIAESVDKELFVYVYQPGASETEIVASSINISRSKKEDIAPKNYKLQLLDNEGTLFKYVVSDFTVSEEETRYYCVVSIFRPSRKGEAAAGNGNTVTEVPYEVAKEYLFGEKDGKPYVDCVEIETIVVTDKFVGFVRYPGGFTLHVEACDSHFVAFNTDKPIGNLLEADVYYTTQAYSYHFAVFGGESETFGEKASKYAYLKYTDKEEYTGGGLFAGTYKWNRIQSVEKFIAAEKRETIYHGAILDLKHSSQLTDEALEALKGKKWVLRFAETDYTAWSADTANGWYSTLVGDVTILRLKFETDGVPYNLGVIDNKQTGSREPVNKEDWSVSLSDGMNVLSLILGLVLLLVILVILGSTGILGWILKVVWWIICLPFRLLALPFQAIFKKRE